MLILFIHIFNIGDNKQKMYQQSVHQYKKDRVSFLHWSVPPLGFSDKNRQPAIRKKELQEYLQGAEGYAFYSNNLNKFLSIVYINGARSNYVTAFIDNWNHFILCNDLWTRPTRKYC